MISFTIIILIFVGRSSGTCIKSTDNSDVQITTVTQLYLANCMVLMESRPIATTKFYTYTTTTIKFDTCVNKVGSNEAERESNYLSQSFNIDFSQLESLVVYSGENIDALKFYFLDGDSSVYGNIKNTDKVIFISFQISSK